MKQEHYWRRTEGWDWFGTQHWWEVFIVFHGFNGTGGANIEERWRWNGSSENLRKEYRNLTLDETRQLLSELGLK